MQNICSLKHIAYTCLSEIYPIGFSRFYAEIGNLRTEKEERTTYISIQMLGFVLLIIGDKMWLKNYRNDKSVIYNSSI